MLKKLTIAFFTLLLCAKVNSQTKLYNDDGSFRTDGFYLVKMCEIPLIAKVNSVIQFPQTYKKWGTYRQQYPNAYAYPYKSIIAFRFYKNNSK